jgi:hypothetical protein
MDRLSDLDALIDFVWTTVTDGAGNPEHPFYTPTFVTRGQPLKDGYPNARTVVLRQADRDERMLLFHSDRRARKVEDIKTDPRIIWHHWNPDTSVQLRLKGRAAVHTSSDVAEALWADATPRQKMLYLKDEEPGAPVDTPRSGIPDEVEQAESLIDDDVEAGRAYFAAVRTVIDEITFLHLHPEGHYRARLVWTGNAWEGSWVIP